MANPTREDIRNRIAIRIPLETLACQEAARQIQRLDFAEFEDLRKTIGQPGMRGDEAFHHYIWDRAENPLLIRTLKQVTAPMFAFLYTLRDAGFQHLDRRKQSHAELMFALRAGGDSKIADAVRCHIDSGYQAFVDSNVRDVKGLAARLRSESLRMGPMPADVSLLQAFLRSAPAVAIIRNARDRLVYANEEFERFTDRQRERLVNELPDAYLDSEKAAKVLAYDAFVREKRQALLTVGCWGKRRMTLRFPIEFESQVMSGALGIDVAATIGDSPDMIGSRALFRSAEGSVPPDRMPVNTALLTAYLNALPTVVAIADRHGEILFANRKYETVTGQEREGILGMRSGDTLRPSVGLVAEDDRIGEQSRPVNRITSDYGVSISFPILDDGGRMDLTGVLGFDRVLVSRGRKMVGALGEGGHASQPLGERTLSYQDQLVE